MASSRRSPLGLVASVAVVALLGCAGAAGLDPTDSAQEPGAEGLALIASGAERFELSGPREVAPTGGQVCRTPPCVRPLLHRPAWYFVPPEPCTTCPPGTLDRNGGRPPRLPWE